MQNIIWYLEIFSDSSFNIVYTVLSVECPVQLKILRGIGVSLFDGLNWGKHYEALLVRI